MRLTGIALTAALALLAGCAPHPAARDQTPPLVIFFLDGVQLSQAEADLGGERTHPLRTP
jgi:hypothetical protein